MTACTVPDCRHDLSDEQKLVLLQPIRRTRVSHMTEGRKAAYVEGYEDRAHLTRIFGFGRWSQDVVDQRMVFEDSQEKDGKTKWFVCYSSRLTLAVHARCGELLATYTEGATGDCMGYQPNRADAHDLALKASQTNALKRCCVNLGDQFGLSLYRQGSLEPLVRKLVHMPEGAEPTEKGDDPPTVDDHITEPLPPEDDGAAPEPVFDTNADQEPAHPEVGRGEPVAVPGSSAEVWRDLVLREPPAKGRPQVHYMRLLANMTKEGVQNALVDVNGAQVTLRALIDRQLAGLGVSS